MKRVPPSVFSPSRAAARRLKIACWEVSQTLGMERSESMDGRKRTVQIKFRVTEAERDLILEKMKLVPTRNMAAYLRKIAIDGYIIQVDHEAAAKALKTAGITKLPNPATLQKEYEALQAQKEALYADYGKLKKKVREYDAVSYTHLTLPTNREV